MFNGTHHLLCEGGGWTIWGNHGPEGTMGVIIRIHDAELAGGVITRKLAEGQGGHNQKFGT